MEQRTAPVGVPRYVSRLPGAAYGAPPPPPPSPPKGNRPVELADAIIPADLLPTQLIQDVHNVATQSGYVGLSDAAIRRAYAAGNSLFVNTTA
jgi:hypothetical protein